MTHHPFSFHTVPKNSPAIQVLSLSFGLLVFFFSPEVVHAEFLDRLELINHLRQIHYSKLEQILTRQERLYQAKKIPEEHVEAAYLSFANSAADLKEKLNEWVTRNDKNGTALLARGIYYWNRGWKSRGGEFFSETPNERVLGMKENFALAWKDFNLASGQKKHSGIPYVFIINIAMALGDREGINQNTLKGLQADPNSFAVRWKYLYSQTPWWGSRTLNDSLAQTATFLKKEVLLSLDQNSDLRPLLGFPDYIRAEMLQRNGKREKSIPYYQQALKKGRYYYYAYGLGENLYFLDQHEEALKVLTAALQDRPQVAEVHDYRARTLEALKLPEQALAEQARAIALDELNPGNLRRYAWRLKRQHHLEEAEMVLTQALTYGSNDHSVLGNLGSLYLEDINDPTRALPYLKKALLLKPEESWYWLTYGWALNKLNDCQGVEALQNYQIQCKRYNSCTSENMEWAKKTSQRMIWKEGCWREHPTLKLLGRLVKWLPKL